MAAPPLMPGSSWSAHCSSCSPHPATFRQIPSYGYLGQVANWLQFNGFGKAGATIQGRAEIDGDYSLNRELAAAPLNVR